MGWSKSRLTQVNERRAKAVALKAAGVRTDDIARQVPGYSSPGHVSMDLNRAYKTSSAELAVRVSELFDNLAGAQYACLERWLPEIVDESVPREQQAEATELVLKTCDRMAKLASLVVAAAQPPERVAPPPAEVPIEQAREQVLALLRSRDAEASRRREVPVQELEERSQEPRGEPGYPGAGVVLGAAERAADGPER